MQPYKKLLADLKQRLERDRQEHFALYNQAIGALLAVEHIEKNVHDDSLSLNEFEEMIDGKVESIDPVKPDVQNAD